MAQLKLSLLSISKLNVIPLLTDHQGHFGQESREGGCVISSGVLSLLHCHQSVWMDSKHGKNHEGPSPAG